MTESSAPFTSPGPAADHSRAADPAPAAAADQGPEASTATAGWTARTWPAAFLIVASGTAIAWFRMPNGVAGQLYAEDGRTFFGDWLTHGGWSLLVEPYAGYQHLIPRTVAWLVMSLSPVAWWAVATNFLACLIVGMAAGLVFVCSRDVVSFWPSRVALGLLTVLTPIVGFEAVGNLANLHWFLLYLSVWVLLATPRSTGGMWALAVVAFLCTATEPQCAIFLPLGVWRIVRSRRMWPVIAGWLLGLAAQVATTVIAPRALGSGRPPLLSTVEGYVLNVGMTLGSNRPRVLGWVVLHLGWWVGLLGVALIVAFAVLGMVKGELIAKVAIAALLYGSVVSWTASFVLGSNPDFFYSQMTDEQLSYPLLVRWGTSASMMLAATIPVTVGALVHQHPRWRRAGAGSLAGLAVIMATSVTRLGPAEPLSWATTVEQARTECSTTADLVVKVPTPPDPGWVVSLPCSLLDEPG